MLTSPAGVVGAAYRAATPPPRRYDGPDVDTPLGLLPIGIITQVARGPDLLGAVIVLQILLAR